PENLEIVTELRAALDGHRGDDDGLLIAELYLPFHRLVRYYGRAGDGVHLPANMHLIAAPYSGEHIAALVDSYQAALPSGAWPNWALGNHDRSRIATRVGPARARVAAMLLLTLRGTPILYYGDEIGMPDVAVPAHLVRDPYELRVPGIGVGRDPARTPMRWTAGRNAGFCPPDVRPWLPLGPAHPGVAAQRRAATSVLSLYRALIALRRSESALSIGAYQRLAADAGLLVYRRRHDGRSLVVALNLESCQRIVPVPVTGRIVLATGLDRTGEVTGPLTLRGDEGVIVAED
ncbi:alpha-amylase family glycosyl hydrolase, partial [Actinophytocola sp.]|uniref:alpha-amylase family glycosyl hydrolase n=1 Tax=Actinophytocola sp. TaxID=1872138 RepID=UPI002D80790D